eukprot:361855-Chlamydomonas_euryale.AAC.2
MPVWHCQTSSTSTSRQQVNASPTAIATTRREAALPTIYEARDDAQYSIVSVRRHGHAADAYMGGAAWYVNGQRTYIWSGAIVDTRGTCNIQSQHTHTCLCL